MDTETDSDAKLAITIRTARSRTSGESRLALPMAQSSQGIEPPANPVRFTCHPRWSFHGERFMVRCVELF
jgi:hypothetical protein